MCRLTVQAECHWKHVFSLHLIIAHILGWLEFHLLMRSIVIYGIHSISYVQECMDILYMCTNIYVHGYIMRMNILYMCRYIFNHTMSAHT